MLREILTVLTRTARSWSNMKTGEHPMNNSPQNKKLSIIGIVFTIVVTLGFIAAAVHWFNRYTWPPKLTIKDLQANEVQAFKNLQLIAQAQQKYKKKDWDRDGKKNYADFFIHLWKSVDANGEPIPVELIPKKLAFATGHGRTIHGYYFRDLHDRSLPVKEQARKLDYEKEWAIFGAPARYAATGFIMFLADNSGRIFAKNQRAILSDYPYDPISDGWSEIKGVKQLANLQKMAYTTK